MPEIDAGSDPLDFNGRTVVVTGETRSLGAVIARSCLSHGADVVVCARREPEHPVESGGRIALFAAADVSEAEQVEAVVAATLEATGRIDVLVNNAGGAPPANNATASPRFNPMGAAYGAAKLFSGDADGITALGHTLAMDRMGDPSEVADVVLFGASPLARRVTGCAIPVHGGGESPAYLDVSTGEVAR